MRSVPCEACELGEAVQCGDVTLVDRETLQTIHDLVSVLIMAASCEGVRV